MHVCDCCFDFVTIKFFTVYICTLDRKLRKFFHGYSHNSNHCSCCILALCPIPIVPNGLSQFTSLSINSTATFSCDPGFEPANGLDTITCTLIDENTAMFLPVPNCNRK